MTADKQLKAYIDRILRLKEEQDALGQDIRDVYAEAKAEGYDKTVMGKLVAHLRKVLKEGDGAIAEAESIFDTYLNAYQRASGMPVAIAHTHEEEFDPITGEFVEPVNAKLVATVANGMQTEIGRKALIAAVDIMIAREEAEETPSADIRAEGREAGSAASLHEQRVNVHSQHEGANAQAIVRNGGVTVVGTESGTVSNGSRSADPAVPGGEPGTPSSDAGGEKMELGANQFPGRRDVKSLHSNAESERATNTNSEIDPTEDREEGHSLEGNDGANAGGDHVNRSVERASGRQQDTHTLNNRLDGVPVQSVKKPLRPLCRNPGDTCGGYGSTHCASCLRASKQAEVAA